MSRLRVSTVALAAALAGGLSASALAGYAVPMSAPRPAPMANWYFNAFGGASIPKDLKDNDGDSIDLNLGYDAGGAIGYRAGPFRFEGQYTFIRNTAKDFRDAGVSLKAQGVPFSGKLTAHAGMANMYYDFDTMSDVLGFYIGGGVGFVHLKATATATVPASASAVTVNASGSDNKFAYQGLAGFTYNVDNQFYLDIGYRYFATTRPRNAASERYVNHLVNFGITYHVPA